MINDMQKEKVQEVRITHLVDAPQELVFEAWTDPRHLQQWYAPEDCRLEIRSIDVSVGGHFHHCIHHPVYGPCWAKGTYIEINYPSKLVFNIKLSDEHGGNASADHAGKDPAWPEEVLTTVLFEKENGKTRIILHQTVSETTARRTGAYRGWLEMLDQLDLYFIEADLH